MSAPATSPVPDEDVAYEQSEVSDDFRVVDADTANWVLRRITACDDEERRIEEFAQKELARVQNERQFFLFRYSRQLQDWAASEIANLKGRRKTIRLPAGSLSFRREASKLVIDDDRAVMEWARTHCPEAIQVTERLCRSIVKAHFEASGQLPETGAHLEPEKESFSIK